MTGEELKGVEEWETIIRGILCEKQNFYFQLGKELFALYAHWDSIGESKFLICKWSSIGNSF